MKRFFILTFCLLFLLAFVGCNSSKSEEKLISGTYYMQGDFDEGLTPYVSLSLEDGGFAMGAGSTVSFQAQGSFSIEGNSLVATTQISTFVFEIKDSKTLILIDNGDNEFFQLKENTEFIHSDTMR